MIATFRYILLTAVRDRLLIGVGVALLLAALLGAFLGEATALERDQISLAYAGFAARLILAAGLILLVCFHVQRSYDNQEIDLMLLRPILRAQFVLIYWLGFSGVGVFLSVLAVVVLPIAGMPDGSGLVVWTLSLFLESLMIVAIGLFFALTLRSAVVATTARLGFYILPRMTGFLVNVAQADLLLYMIDRIERDRAGGTFAGGTGGT